MTEGQAAEHPYRDLAELAPVGLFLAGFVGDYRFVNLRWTAITGLDATAASGDGWLDAVAPADRVDVARVWRQAVRDGEPFSAEYRLQRADGGQVWVLGRASLERDAEGAIVGYIGTLTDISVRRSAGAALRASEQKFASAFAVSPQAISITAVPSSQFLDVNEALLRVTGYTRDELIGRTPLDVGLWADAREWELGREAILMEGRLSQREVRFRRKDGGIIVGLAAAERIDFGGQTAILTVIADITARKRVERDLLRSEERYRTLVESIDQGVCILQMIDDAQGRPIDYRFLEVNPTFERHTGLQHAVGRTARELVPDLEDHWVETYGRVASSGETVHFEQGSAAMGRWFEVQAVRIGDPANRQVALFFTDVSERRRAEQALQSSARRDAFRAALTDTLRPLTDPVAIERETARLLGEQLGVGRAFYAAAEPNGEYVTIRHDYHRGVPSIAGRYRLFDFGDSLAAAFREGRTLVVDDVATDSRLSERERASYDAVGVRAHVTVWLIKEGQLFGLLGVRQGSPRAWSPEDIALVEETAERMWAAVERAGAEAAVRAGERRLHLALAGARAGAWQWDLASQRVIWSPEHYDLLGLAPNGTDFGQGTFTDFIHPDDRARVQAGFAMVMERREPFELEFRIIRADGAVRWFTTVGRVEFDDEGRAVQAIGISQDITERRRAEQRFALLAEVGETLAGTLDEGVALDTLAHLLVRVLADWCLVSTLESDGLVHRRAYAHAQPELEALLRDLPATYPYVPGYPYGASNVIAEGRSRFTPTLTAEELAERSGPLHLAALRQLGVGSGMVVPLRARGGTFGALSILRASGARPFDRDDLALAEQIADRAAVALDSARSYAAERAARSAAEQAVRRQRAQAEAARLFAEAGPELGPLLDTAARYLANLIGDGSVIGLIAADGERIDLAAADHRIAAIAAYSRQEFIATPLRVGVGIIGTVAQTGEPALQAVVSQPDLLADADPGHYPLLERHFPHSLMVVPCRADGRTIGVIALARHTPNRPYTRDDLALLGDLADRAGLAIERARLYDAERRAREVAEAAQGRLALLADAGIALAGSLDEGATLTALAGLIVPRFADWCTINLVGDDGLRPPIALHADPDRQPALDRLLSRYPATPRGGGPVARVLEEGESVLSVAPGEGLLDDYAPDAMYLDLLAQVGLNSTIIVPLVARQRLLGALRFARIEATRPYDADDLRLAEELTRRAALALDNARLYRESRDAIAARDRFLSIAAHELRTPVTSMRAYAQLAQRRRERGQLTNELIGNSLATIERGTARLNTLIQDLLDVARLQAGQLRIERGELDLAALLETALTEAQAQLPPALALVATGTARPFPIFGDAGRLEQVLGNLLENARKYSPDGGTIAVDLATDRTGATITVRDEGIGLDPGEVERIFTPFNRSEEALRRQIQGLGLGLAICRAIVEEHGGTLVASSVGPGHGTVFTLRLPKVRGESARAVDVGAR